MPPESGGSLFRNDQNNSYRSHQSKYNSVDGGGDDDELGSNIWSIVEKGGR